MMPGRRMADTIAAENTAPPPRAKPRLPVRLTFLRKFPFLSHDRTYTSLQTVNVMWTKWIGASMRGRFPRVQSLGVLFGVVVFVAAGSAVGAAKAKNDKAGKAAAKPSIEKASYGTVDGKPVDIYTLTNAKGAFAKITNYGAIVTELH